MAGWREGNSLLFGASTDHSGGSGLLLPVKLLELLLLLMLVDGGHESDNHDL